MEMWIQLLLPVELPIAKKAKTRRARKNKAKGAVWIQLEIKLELKELTSYTPNTPSIINKAWKWIKAKVKAISSKLLGAADQ